MFKRPLRIARHGCRDTYSVRYQDEILDPFVRPFAGAIGNNFILMQDNARLYTVRLIMDYFYHEGIEVMDWPERLPDLNPIEHA